MQTIASKLALDWLIYVQKLHAKREEPSFHLAHGLIAKSNNFLEKSLWIKEVKKSKRVLEIGVLLDYYK